MTGRASDSTNPLRTRSLGQRFANADGVVCAGFETRRRPARYSHDIRDAERARPPVSPEGSAPLPAIQTRNSTTSVRIALTGRSGGKPQLVGSRTAARGLYGTWLSFSRISASRRPALRFRSKRWRITSVNHFIIKYCKLSNKNRVGIFVNCILNTYSNATLYDEIGAGGWPFYEVYGINFISVVCR